MGPWSLAKVNNNQNVRTYLKVETNLEYRDLVKKLNYIRLFKKLGEIIRAYALQSNFIFNLSK